MRVGVLSLWFARGQAYVARNAIKALEARGHDVYLMARKGFVKGGDFLETTGEWARENMTTYPEYNVNVEVFQSWIKDNKLDAVVFVEEQWQKEPTLTQVAKDSGVRVINIIMREAYNRQEREYYEPCDAIICPTLTSHEYVNADFPKTTYNVTWGADFDEFDKLRKDIKREDNDLRFFHPGGWGGMHNRRGTPDALASFNLAISSEREIMEAANAVMLMTSQQNVNAQRIKVNTKVDMIVGTISREKLLTSYLHSDIAVLPSMWEGLGLTFLEAMAAGVAIITVDGAPMNEFVVDGYNGIVVPAVTELSFPGINTTAYDIDVRGFAKAIFELAKDKEQVAKMKTNALECARNKYDWAKNGERFVDIVEGILA